MVDSPFGDVSSCWGSVSKYMSSLGVQNDDILISWFLFQLLAELFLQRNTLCYLFINQQFSSYKKARINARFFLFTSFPNNDFTSIIPQRWLIFLSIIMNALFKLSQHFSIHCRKYFFRVIIVLLRKALQVVSWVLLTYP